MGNLLLRVDDVGWLPPNKTKDEGLAYFTEWRKALGSESLPAYYGVIPSCIGPREVEWLKQSLKGGEEVAVHGHDHARGAVVTDKQMADDNRLLEKAPRNRAYIAPFNDYTERTVKQWGRVAINGYFFGGFPGDNHKLGPIPTLLDNCWHLPTFRPTYDHSEQLIENLPNWLDLDCPLVVTLHATWGWQRLDLLRKIMQIIKPHLVPLDFVPRWHDKSRLSLARLTAPHYLAYNWICNRLSKFGLGKNVLDFGARYSELPSQLALRGHRVTVYDRDPLYVTYQHRLSKNFGATVKAENWTEDKYDAIVCCWALQHNLPAADTIPAIVKNLASKLNKGGSLLVVGSFTTNGSYEQHDRQDPQAVLNMADHRRLIIGPSELSPVYPYPEFFYYEPNSTLGSYCLEPQANAVCYELKKA